MDGGGGLGAGVSAGDSARAAARSVAVGRLGEALAFHELKAQLAALQPGPGPARLVAKWVNADGERGLPYDLVVVAEGTGQPLRFIEVKATRRSLPDRDGSTEDVRFPISMAELAFGYKHPNSWQILLAVGVHVVTASDDGQTVATPALKEILLIPRPVDAVNRDGAEAAGPYQLTLTLGVQAWSDGVGAGSRAVA